LCAGPSGQRVMAAMTPAPSVLPEARRFPASKGCGRHAGSQGRCRYEPLPEVAAHLAARKDILRRDQEECHGYKTSTRGAGPAVPRLVGRKYITSTGLDAYGS